MTSLLRSLRPAGAPVERAGNAQMYIDLLMQSMTFGGHLYKLAGQQTLQAGREEIANDFCGVVQGAYKRNGVVFAVMLTRLLLFSEARFQFQQLSAGKPGKLFGTADLQVLEKPWPGATTGDLLGRMEQDVSLAGNSFTAHPFVRRGGTLTTQRTGKLARLRPDWVTIVSGSPNDAEVDGWDPDAEVLGYAYHPGGALSGKQPIWYDRTEVAHYAPIPDPEARWRGMSWLTPIVREVEADGAATRHKAMFFEQGATPNLVVKSPITDPEKFAKWVELMRGKTEGLANAYRTMYIGGGAEVVPVGANLQQLEFKITQGAGETRIAAAGGVPPVIVGLSEGLQAATYSNYGQARRRLADGTMRPLWRNAAGSLETIVNVPSGARLWYDTADVAFLREDEKDAAEIASTKASAMKTLVDAGYTPESVVTAVESGDLTLLQHSGLVSVQLQPPGAAASDTNGQAV